MLIDLVDLETKSTQINVTQFDFTIYSPYKF